MIPFATTTVDFERPSARDEDSDIAQEWVPVAYVVPGNVVSPNGTDAVIGGEQEVVDAVLIVGLEVGFTPTYLDRATDRGTGEVYQVTWVRRRQGFGLDHWRMGLRAVKGVAR